MGIHSFGNMPSKIASYLKLDNPKQYTGHCFRRSSATALAGNGVDITTLKRHGSWKSTSVAEGYIEYSMGAKISIANQIANKSEIQICCNNQSTSSNHEASSVSQISSSSSNFQLKLNDTNLPNINISHLENCTINFNFK